MKQNVAPSVLIRLVQEAVSLMAHFNNPTSILSLVETGLFILLLN